MKMGVLRITSILVDHIALERSCYCEMDGGFLHYITLTIPLGIAGIILLYLVGQGRASLPVTSEILPI